MKANITFIIYTALTYLISLYVIIDRYYIEGQYVTFSLYLLKSKAYLCMTINLVITTYILLARMIIWLFLGYIRESEVTGVKEKVKVKLYSMFILFMTMRPSIDLEKILLVLHTYFVIIFNLLSFERAAYIVKLESTNRLGQIKMVLLYVMLSILNYVTYLLVSSTLSNLGINLLSFKYDENLNNVNLNTSDALIYTIFSTEALFIQLKLVVKILKLLVDITELYYQKIWEYNKLCNNIFNLIRFIFKALIEIKFSIIILKTGVLPLFIFINAFYSVYSIIKQVYNIHEYIKLKKTILKLEDYVSNPENNNENKHVSNCICLEEVKLGKKLPCGHVYHLHCIKYNYLL